MANIRSINELVLQALDYLRVAQPELDTKPGEVARDLFIDLPASQIALLYEELSKISSIQSIRSAVGSDLDKIGQNYGVQRKGAAKATGLALLTFSSLSAPIAITKNASVIDNSNATFLTQNTLTVDPTQSNFYKSIATKYKADLDFVGITDQYAVEITVTAALAGSAGNIAKYSLSNTFIPGVTNVTNTIAFSGGSDQENDDSYRNRILSIFSGASTGTATGYKNIALQNPSVLDALVIQPGDTLMLRDGTQISTLSDGTKIITKEGRGGTVDVVILGTLLQETLDTWIYRDKSNTGDATNSKNDIILGQVDSSTTKTVTQKRADALNNGTLPAQPVDEVLEVTGTFSGPNFVPKSVDQYGRISGNYEIVKDTSVYSGSPFGFDKFHWISNSIDDFQENKVKNQFNGQDRLVYSDYLKSNKLQQNIQITNENSTLSSTDRSFIFTLHTPITNVTRVFNTTTGETYVITSQNPDGTGSVNNSGRIQITGNTLPTYSDVLQVDYEWIYSYDPIIDYDGKIDSVNPRSVQDSIDWGLSNAIRNELVTVTRNASNTFFLGNLIHQISSVISAKIFEQINGVVTTDIVNFPGKKIVLLNDLPNLFSSIESAKIQNTNIEVYNTASADGLLTSSRLVIGSEIRYNATIILPTDTHAVEGDGITFIYNATDIWNVNGSVGNTNSTQITIPVGNTTATDNAINLLVSYIANIQEIYNSLITNLPASRVGNSLNSNTSFKLNFNPSTTIIREAATLINNGSFVSIKTNLSSQEYNLTSANILTIVRISDSSKLWDAGNVGSITVDTDNKYFINLPTYNGAAANQQVILFYQPFNYKKPQPFTFQNKVWFDYNATVQLNTTTSQYYVDLPNFISESGLAFSIVSTINDTVLISGTDGQLTVTTNGQALFTSTSVDFANYHNIVSYKVKITSAINEINIGIFDIYSINETGQLTLSINLNHLSTNQVLITRLSDGQEIWSNSGTIDLDNWKLILPGINFTQLTSVYVVFYTTINEKSAPTQLSITTSDQVNNTGVLTLVGDVIYKAENILFQATQNGLKQNITSAIKTAANISSTTQVNSNWYLARLATLEKVSVTGSEVLSVDVTFDTSGTQIKNSILFDNMVQNDTFSNLDFELPNTSTNSSNELAIGDWLRATFYYVVPSQSENITFTKNGTLYSNKKYAFINTMYISSGFRNTSSARFTINNLNQPITGTKYNVYYNYTAPKTNERIVVRYNYNKLIGDVSFDIENGRPINADVLVRAAKALEVDVIMNIVIKSDQISSANLIVQSVKDKITAAINTNKLGDVIDSSDLIVVAQSVSGVDRSRVLYFNKDMAAGQVLSIQAADDEYFNANNITINIESR